MTHWKNCEEKGTENIAIRKLNTYMINFLGGYQLKNNN
jgi:hypothetical protein